MTDFAKFHPSNLPSFDDFLSELPCANDGEPVGVAVWPGVVGAGGIPEPFDHLPEDVKRIWRAFAPVYAVSLPDLPLFEIFCDAYARWQLLIGRANDVGAVVTIAGDVAVNPNLARADKEATNFKQALALMLRNKLGRMRDADESQNNQGQAEPDGFEAIRNQLIARIAESSTDDEGSDGDRKKARNRTTKTKKAVKAPAARTVRKKAGKRRGTPKAEESSGS